MHLNTWRQALDRRLCTMLGWSTITAFALYAVANFLLRHLTPGQTVALFGIAFLEMMVIRILARTEAGDAAAMAEARGHAEDVESAQAVGTS
jgi:hypothetical protein